MITAKQRAYLRSLANSIDPILQIGKAGIGENLITQVDDALNARELIKITVLRNSPLEPYDACDELCAAVGADPVSTVGNRIVLYRESKEHKQIYLTD